MTKREMRQIGYELSSISVFRSILSQPPMACLMELLNSADDVYTRLNLFGSFVFSLSYDNNSFSEYLARAVYSDENRFIVNASQGKENSFAFSTNAVRELMLFSKLTTLSAESFREFIGYDGDLPQFDNEQIDFESTYQDRMNHIGDYGYGIFANNIMFRVSGSEILPVAVADTINEEDFVGYERERKQLFDNTIALIEGRPAANVLLFGDAGTGKSSSVKACANYFSPRGIRLIEIRKDQLFGLSDVMAKIRDNPLKFIIFIDDLSFNKNDDCFSMLKAALEGSASASASNAVIYATSNRRHIVKETFAERDGMDDVHRNDTIQELMSLSERFGLTIYYEKPNKQLFTEIVKTLAARNQVPMDEQELVTKAEAYALRKGSRSPRAAKQFVESLM